jgi:hypothetical protein
VLFRSPLLAVLTPLAIVSELGRCQQEQQDGRQQ